MTISESLIQRFLPSGEVNVLMYAWDGEREPDDGDIRGSGDIDLRSGEGTLTLGLSRRQQSELGASLPEERLRQAAGGVEFDALALARGGPGNNHPLWYLSVLDGADQAGGRALTEEDGERVQWRGPLDFWAARRSSKVRPRLLLPPWHQVPGGKTRSWYRACPARVEARPGRIFIALRDPPRKDCHEAWTAAELSE